MAQQLKENWSEKEAKQLAKKMKSHVRRLFPLIEIEGREYGYGLDFFATPKIGNPDEINVRIHVEFNRRYRGYGSRDEPVEFREIVLSVRQANQRRDFRRSFTPSKESRMMECIQQCIDNMTQQIDVKQKILKEEKKFGNESKDFFKSLGLRNIDTDSPHWQTTTIKRIKTEISIREEDNDGTIELTGLSREQIRKIVNLLRKGL